MIIIIGASKGLGKSLAEKFSKKELLLISRSSFETNHENHFNINSDLNALNFDLIKKNYGHKKIEAVFFTVGLSKINDNFDFAEQFKHVQRWSDINKLKSWTTQSDLIKETGLKYLSARLNYLQTLPYRVRPAHALGEGTYRAARNQLKGSAKSLSIEGLTIDSRLMAKDWLKKAQK
mgnify:CR=1 FL=1